MRHLLVFLFTLLTLTACNPTINIYRHPVNRLNLKNSAFKEFANLTYKNGRTERILFTTVKDDSITIINVDDKSVDPAVKTISFNDIQSIQVFEEKDGDYVVYTFDKPEN